MDSISPVPTTITSNVVGVMSCISYSCTYFIVCLSTLLKLCLVFDVDAVENVYFPAAHARHVIAGGCAGQSTTRACGLWFASSQKH